MSSSEEMRPVTAEAAQHVRVRVEMVLELTDADEVIRAAWARIHEDDLMPDEERRQAADAVAQDPAEAIAYLLDPVDLVTDVPGIELAQASWSSELAEYDPEETWDSDDE
ncbi:hypothetical protein SUDANB171_01995 [Streptomyces sp. enrichment culture]|jgi:hypothetical protein|uniref:hypothetical protein n=1 Tax=Streptomyces xiamenensis TaxID=408015 RepID=UPI0036E06FC2